MFTIKGVVIDKITEQPLSKYRASILQNINPKLDNTSAEFKKPYIAPILDDKGNFTLDILPEHKKSIKIEADGYKTANFMIKNTDKIQEFYLDPAPEPKIEEPAPPPPPERKVKPENIQVLQPTKQKIDWQNIVLISLLLVTAVLLAYIFYKIFFKKSNETTVNQGITTESAPATAIQSAPAPAAAPAPKFAKPKPTAAPVIHTGAPKIHKI